jgi:hypothetical protein
MQLFKFLLAALLATPILAAPAGSTAGTALDARTEEHDTPLAVRGSTSGSRPSTPDPDFASLGKSDLADGQHVFYAEYPLGSLAAVGDPGEAAILADGKQVVGADHYALLVVTVAAKKVTAANVWDLIVGEHQQADTVIPVGLGWKGDAWRFTSAQKKSVRYQYVKMLARAQKTATITSKG